MLFVVFSIASIAAVITVPLLLSIWTNERNKKKTKEFINHYNSKIDRKQKVNSNGRTN